MRAPGTARRGVHGLLSFFYDGEQEAWGFDPAHRGGWWVSLAHAGVLPELEEGIAVHRLLGHPSTARITPA